MFRFSNLLKAVLVLGGIGASGVALAQEAWPARPITLVVPVAAGTGTDIGARLVAKHMATTLNVPVVVENKVGANGMIGAQYVARARADGHVLLVGNATSNAANYAFYQGQAKLGYTPASFEIAGAMGLFPMSLYVAATSPWRTLGDLVADARRQPGKFNCGSGNSTTQVACEVLRKKAAIDIVTVPYKGNPQSLMDVAGGQLSFAFADAAIAQSFVDGRKLRALAVAATQRNPLTPEAPTFIEQGYPGFEITTWLALFAPAGTPPAVLERLNGAVRHSNQTPEAVQSRARSGGVVVTQTLPEARRWIDAEVKRWMSFIEATGVKPE